VAKCPWLRPCSSAFYIAGCGFFSVSCIVNKFTWFQSNHRSRLLDWRNFIGRKQCLPCCLRGYTYAVVTCEIKWFQNYFTDLLQLINIFQHVHCRWNNFEIISMFYFTCNRGISVTVTVTAVCSWHHASRNVSGTHVLM